ncbi:hypothetical protein [Tessaracoccus sp. Y1736]
MESMTAILHAVQGLVTNIGSALIREGKSKTPSGGVKKATRFCVTTNAWPGSVVFHLDREGTETLVESKESGSLAEMSVNRLLEVLGEAERDSAESIGAVVEQVRPLGARTASHLAKLVTALEANEYQLALSHSLASGHRRRASLGERGCMVLREAVDRNRKDDKNVTLVGHLNTSSDVDSVKLTLGDNSTVKLKADPDTGIQLGKWLAQQVEIVAERHTEWLLASGIEKVTYRILEARLADPTRQLPPG